MLFELVIALKTVVFISSFLKISEQAECGDWKPKAPFYLKNSKQQFSPDFNPNLKYRGELENAPLSNLGWNRYRIAKRDDVTKDNEEWSEAFNMFDWWKNLRPNRKQNTKQKPVSNSVKRVCFDELLNAQLSNKSYLSLIHYKPRLSEPFGYFETINSPWSTAKLTEVQMDNSVKSVINATDDVNENAVTTSSSYETEKYEDYTTNPSFRDSTILDNLQCIEFKKNKNKTETKLEKDKCLKPEKVKPEKCDKVKTEKPEKVKPEKCDKVKTEKPEKVKPEKCDKVKTEKPEKCEKNSNRLILTLNDDKKGPCDSKTSKPFGNFSVEYVENAGKAPSIDSTTMRIIIKTSGNDSSNAGGKKKSGLSIENSDTNQFHWVNDQEVKLSINEDELLVPDDSKVNKTRKVRSLYPNPMDSRQFHLMHGLYSGDGAQMEDALRQAEIQALNVASDLQRASRLRQANSFDMYGPGFRMQQEQIMPEPRDISINEETINERNRHSKRKTNLLPNDPYISFDTQLKERMKFLNDINSAITKKKEELDVLERTFKNEQSIVSPQESNIGENKLINPNTMNNPELNQQLIRPFQFSNTGERIENTNINHESLPRINPNIPIMTNNINLNDSLVNNPYLESILRAYASNYLNPILNQQNLTSPEFHKRNKRDVASNFEIERPPTLKKRRCSRYVPPNIDKENLLNSLKELEELERILMKEYEKDFGSMIDKKPDKRWLLSGRDARTMSPYAGLADETCLSAQKCEPAEVLQPDLLMGKKKHPNKTMCTDYSKKFCVLENDLIDLKNAISNINNDQNKMDKSDNDTNNILVQVNVSVALFNGSSTPPGCECVCKRDSDSLKSPIATLVTVNKINVTDAPGQNKKTQDNKSMVLLRAFDRKRDLAKLEDQILMARSSEDWSNKWKSSTRSDNDVFKTKSMNRTEAIQNLNEQFEAIEKTLTDEARSIRKTHKLSKIDAGHRLIYPYFKTHNEYYQQPSRWDIKPSTANSKKKFQCRSSRSYKNQLSSRIYEPKRNLLNFIAQKDLDSNRKNDEKFQNVVNNKEKLKCPLKKKVKPGQTKTSQPYTKTFQKIGPSTEPTLYIREDNSAETLKEMLQNEITKPEIKNFTIILNRKRKDCQKVRGVEDILEFEKCVNHYKPALYLSDKWNKIKTRNINNEDVPASRILREIDKPLFLKQTKNYKTYSYSKPEFFRPKKQAHCKANVGCEYMKHNGNLKATDHKVITDINSYNSDHEWDFLNNWKNNDDICSFAEESPSNEKDNNKYNFNPNIGRNNDSVKTDVNQLIARSCRGLADNNSTSNTSCVSMSFAHKCDKRSTMRKNIIDADKNSDVITDLVIPLHFVHFSNKNKSLSHQAGSKEMFNLKPSYSIISNTDKQIFNNSDDYLHEANYVQNCDDIISDSSYAVKQRQVRNTATTSSFEIVLMPMPDKKKQSSILNKKVLIDFSTNLNEDTIKFHKKKLKPSVNSLQFSNDPKNSQKTRKLIVDLEGMEDEPTTTCRSEVYDIIQIQKQVYFRLSTPASYHANDKFDAKKQNFDNIDCLYSNKRAFEDLPNASIENATRSYGSIDSFDFDITSKYKTGLTSRKEEKEAKRENVQKALNYWIQRNEPKIIHSKRNKETPYARKPVGRRKSFISSYDSQPLIKENYLIPFNHQVRRRPPAWVRKKKTQDFLKKLEEEMTYDDIFSLEEDTSDQANNSNDLTNNEDNDRGDYNVRSEPIYDNEEVVEETPLQWGEPGADEPEEKNVDTYNSNTEEEETIPRPELKESKIRFLSSNKELADLSGEERDEPSIDMYTSSARYPPAAEEFSTRPQLTKFKVSSSTRGHVTKKVTIHPAHIHKEHKKYANTERCVYKMGRLTSLPKYRIQKPVTDLIYFNRFSLKIGERTTVEATTEPSEVIEATPSDEQIHQVRKLSKKFRKSASKLKDDLRKMEKHNRLMKMYRRMCKERKLRNRQRLEEEEDLDNRSDERLTHKRIKIRRRPRDNNITNNSVAP